MNFGTRTQNWKQKLETAAVNSELGNGTRNWELVLGPGTGPATGSLNSELGTEARNWELKLGTGNSVLGTQNWELVLELELGIETGNWN